MLISDWSSDVCSSDLSITRHGENHRRPGDWWQAATVGGFRGSRTTHLDAVGAIALRQRGDVSLWSRRCRGQDSRRTATVAQPRACAGIVEREHRSEEHTSELQSLMRNPYDVFCLKQQKTQQK